MIDSPARWNALGIVLARRMPRVLVAMIALVEMMLETANVDISSDRMPTGPITLTAEQVLEAARARGISAFGTGKQILLASLGLDLERPEIRAALVEMHHRGELRLTRIDNPGAARVALDARGLRFGLVEDSIICDGTTIFHAVVLS